MKKLKPFARLAHTLTKDNGKKLVWNERTAASLKLNYYFAYLVPSGIKVPTKT